MGLFVGQWGSYPQASTNAKACKTNVYRRLHTLNRYSYRVVMQGKKESRKECTVYDVNEKRYIRNVDLLRTWKDSGQENGDEK